MGLVTAETAPCPWACSAAADQNSLQHSVPALLLQSHSSLSCPTLVAAGLNLLLMPSVSALCTDG